MKSPSSDIKQPLRQENNRQESRSRTWFETPRTRWQLRFLFPLICWRLSKARNSVFLSFDDGPIPGVTDRILEILEHHKAKASFFCIGENAERNPELIERMTSMGHAVGNHTYSHLSGWRTSYRDYLRDIDRCEQILPKPPRSQHCLFRPPFGQLGFAQGFRLIASKRIVMWDVNAMDYNLDQTPNMIADRVCRFTRPGSIILLHDSAEAGPRTIQALPTILETLTTRGLTFESIE